MSKASEQLRLETAIAEWRTGHPGYEKDGATLGIFDRGAERVFWKRTGARCTVIDPIEFKARGGASRAQGDAPVKAVKTARRRAAASAATASSASGRAPSTR